MFRDGVFRGHRQENLVAVAAGGTPTAQAVLGPVPEGYAWYLEVITFAVIGNSHTAVFDLAVTPDNGSLPAQATWDHQGAVLTVTPAAVRGTSPNAVPIYVPPAHYVHAYFSGGTLAAGDVATVALQIATHELNPLFLQSREEIERELASHERRPAHEVVEVATASRRAV